MAVPDSQSPSGDTSAVDRTPLVELFGDGARARMLSVFLGDRNYDLSITEIADFAGLARSTVYEHIDDFERLGIVERSRERRGAMYQLDDESPIAQKLYELDGVTLEGLLGLDDQSAAKG